MKYKFHIIAIVSVLTVSLLTQKVAAEEIVVTGNGTESANQVNTSQNNDTNVLQNNDMHVDNTVKVDASSGDNNASGNTGGDATVKTGSVSLNTAISNSGNTSTITQDCCTTSNNGGSVNISGNGSGSQNNANQSFSSKTNVKIDQNANITNNIFGTAITGYNRANDNTGGDVTIDSGDIRVNELIHNDPINIAKVQLVKTVAGLTMVKIAGNGSYSDKDVNEDENNDTNVDIQNNANIENFSKWDLVTGHNDAKDNTDGDVSILTGDIAFKSEITNVANISKVEIKCCEKEKEKEKQKEVPVGAVTTVTEKTTQKNGENPSGGKGGGEVLGAAIGNVLPVTGNAGFFFALLANMLFLLFGVMLRLRAGRSPGLVRHRVFLKSAICRFFYVCFHIVPFLYYNDAL